MYDPSVLLGCSQTLIHAFDRRSGGPSKGTRMRPLSLDIPKPLFPIAGAHSFWPFRPVAECSSPLDRRSRHHLARHPGALKVSHLTPSFSRTQLTVSHVCRVQGLREVILIGFCKLVDLGGVGGPGVGTARSGLTRRSLVARSQTTTRCSRTSSRRRARISRTCPSGEPRELRRETQAADFRRASVRQLTGGTQRGGVTARTREHGSQDLRFVGCSWSRWLRDFGERVDEGGRVGDCGWIVVTRRPIDGEKRLLIRCVAVLQVHARVPESRNSRRTLPLPRLDPQGQPGPDLRPSRRHCVHLRAFRVVRLESGSKLTIPRFL